MFGRSMDFAFAVEFCLILLAGAAVLSFALVVILMPALERYVLARPNARSSHKRPTPQGGGIAVIAATTIVFGAAAFFTGGMDEPVRIAAVFASVIFLALVGISDDLRPLGPLPRLLLQALAVLIVILTLPESLRVFSILPWALERALMFIALLWFVNLVNFMDGIDWMTVAEVVPVTAALALFGLLGALPADATLVSFALCGAMIGFAPFNKPVSRLFLGDVGSLPIGLLLGWLLVQLAGNGHLAAALLLPLYYLADATITLLLRLMRGAPIMQAHREHFYQNAIDGGSSVQRIVAQVFVVNIVLIIFATSTLLSQSRLFHVTVFAIGCGLVGSLLYRFSHIKAQS
jgi:UDP-N-acetylmuramyl pentapeptide phosphotransferase/UDP-N-acetylglucosamine-1-phosphate transferase